MDGRFHATDPDKSKPVATLWGLCTRQPNVATPITCDGAFSMGLEMAGTIVYTDTHTPSEAELNACPHIVLTSPHPWDPMNICFNRNTHLLEDKGSRICQ
eukprot:6561951-Ditylum_brightwellii.AAC.1